MKSILQADPTYCFYCGGWATDRHHCLGGSHSNRVYCDEDGLVIRVCRRCHDKLHSSADLSHRLRALAQEKWEERSTAENPRTEWMKRYGRNYL